MPRRLELPDELGPAFSTAEARAVGVTRKQLRRPALVVPFRGARLLPGHESWEERLLALSRGLRADAVFSHTTAARLWRLPLPQRLARDDAPIHVTVPCGASQPRGAAVTGHRADREPDALRGLAVTTLLDTWCDLAALLTRDDLVAAGDAVLNRAPDGDAGSYTAHDLRTAWDRLAARRGAARVHEAVELVRPGSASPRESMARLRFHDWGLPEPELNADLFGPVGWIACLDFLWRSRGVAGEYRGEHHGRQWREDYRRQAMITDVGCTLVVMTSYDLGPGADDLRRRLTRLLLD